MSDLELLIHHDRFYLKGNTPVGKAWIRRCVSSDTESISIEFLPDYEKMLQSEGLTFEVKRS